MQSWKLKNTVKTIPKIVFLMEYTEKDNLRKHLILVREEDLTYCLKSDILEKRL
jgi:hypothetical protein